MPEAHPSLEMDQSSALLQHLETLAVAQLEVESDSAAALAPEVAKLLGVVQSGMTVVAVWAMQRLKSGAAVPFSVESFDRHAVVDSQMQTHFVREHHRIPSFSEQKK